MQVGNSLSLSGVGVVVWQLAPPHFLNQKFKLATITTVLNCHGIFTILTISLIISIEQLFVTQPNTAAWGVQPMEINAEKIKQEIRELLDHITDIETLDFVHKLLLSECGQNL